LCLQSSGQGKSRVLCRRYGSGIRNVYPSGPIYIRLCRICRFAKLILSNCLSGGGGSSLGRSINSSVRPPPAARITCYCYMATLEMEICSPEGFFIVYSLINSPNRTNLARKSLIAHGDCSVKSVRGQPKRFHIFPARFPTLSTLLLFIDHIKKL
jgi:hypothetical protein